MFELISYDINKVNNKYVIIIFIRNTSENFFNTSIVLKDSIFGQCTKSLETSFEPKSTLWVSWDLTQENPSKELRGLQLSSLWGANLKILINDEVINEFKLKYFITNLNIRLGVGNFSPFNKKKFWILGDSHAGYYTNASPEFLTTSKYDIVPLGMLNLALNNFLKSDWETWFNTFPIFDDDIVAFDLGEIDLRCSLFMASTKYNLDLNTLTKELLKRYFDFIIYFKTNFKNEIVIISPNRPIKDGYLTGNVEYYKLNLTNTQQRLELWTNFNNQLKFFCEENSIKYWDIKHMYTDKDGTLFNDIFNDDDIHIKVKEPMLFDLKHKIENNF